MVWAISLLLGFLASAVLVGVGFVLLVAGGLGRLPPALGSLSRIILGVGLRVSDDKPAVAVAVSIVFWTAILTLTIGLIRMALAN